MYSTRRLACVDIFTRSKFSNDELQPRHIPRQQASKQASKQSTPERMRIIITSALAAFLAGLSLWPLTWRNVNVHENVHDENVVPVVPSVGSSAIIGPAPFQENEESAPTAPTIALLPVVRKDGTTTTAVSSTLLQLRWDWTRLERRQGSLAQRMAAHQQNCSLPLATFRFRNRFGLGSDLHVYSQALCNALEQRVRVHTSLPWIWRVATTTSARNEVVGSDCESNSAMSCYFPQAELGCDKDRQLDAAQMNQLRNLTRGRGRIRNNCPTVLAEHTVSQIRAATTEFLFTRVSSLVQDEAQRQMRLVFAPLLRHGGSSSVPHRNLITVHIRWGDKADEMTLVSIDQYVSAVAQLVAERQDEDPEWIERGIHIFLATEDPRAVHAFQNVAPVDWNIYVDQYFREMLPYRRDTYNGSPLMAQDLNGRPGLLALGSLLVAMEADSFVLTTSSNWSRLMNELRRNILDPRCGNCTRWIDLSVGEW
jgi:hypothetical protein